MKFSRTTLVACVCLLAFGLIAPTASAQQGGRGGAKAGMRKGGKKGGKRAAKRRAAAALAPKAPRDAPPLSGPSRPTKEQLDDDARFEKLIDAIDAKLAAADEAPRDLLELDESMLELPPGIGPGSPLWADLERPIFAACDADRSGWISYREARDALEIDRADFVLYDVDRDGRIGSREFNTRYEEVVEATGVFHLPKLDNSRQIIPRSPRQLTAAFDANGDAALELGEIETMLRDYDREEVDPALVIERLDQDASGKLDGAEVQQLSRLVAAAFVLPLDPAARKAATNQVDDLFGTLEPREGAHDETSLPPRIVGPVTHFRRLDLDADGYVTNAELNKLQSPLQLSARVSTTLASLDTDEDGKLSRAEFLDALRVTRQP